MNLQSKVALIVFAALAAVFTLPLRPFDYFNLGIFLYTGSYLALGQNPNSVLTVVTPPNLDVLSYFAFWVYNLSGSNLYAPVVFYKIVNGLAIIGSGVLLGLIAHAITGGKVFRSRILAAYLFSVPTIFYSFIHVELDAYGIFFTVAALYVLLVLKPLRRGDFLRILSGMVLLGYAVFSYLFPVVLIPTLIVYARTPRERVLFLLGIILALCLFGIPLLKMGLFTVSNPNVGINPPAPSPYTPIFVVNPKYPDLTGTAQLVWFGLIATIFPFLLKRLGVSLSVSMFTIVSLLFFVVPIYNADNFVWIVPFLLLAVAETLGLSTRLSTLLLLQLILVPEIVVFNFYDGLTGMGTGIYYLFNQQFGNSTVVWILVPDHVLVTQLLIGSVFAGLTLLILWLGLDSRKASFNLESSIVKPPSPHSDSSERQLASRIRPYRPSEWFDAIATSSPTCVVVVSLFVGALAVSSIMQPPVATSINGTNPMFPTGIFLVHPPEDANLSFYQSNGGASIVLPATNVYRNGSIAFLRSAENESDDIAINFNVTASADTIYNTTIVRAENLSLNVMSDVSIPSDGLLAPSIVNNSSAAFVTSSFWGGEQIVAYDFAGNSSLQYFISTTGQPVWYSLLYHPVALKYFQNVVWRISAYPSTAVLYGFVTDWGFPGYALEISSAPGVWNTTYFYPTNNTEWDVSSLLVENSTVLAYLNNVPILALHLSRPSFGLLVGRYDTTSNSSFYAAFNGQISSVYETAAPLTLSPSVLVMHDGLYSSVAAYSPGSFSLKISGDEATLNFSDQSWTAKSPQSTYAIGRLSLSSVTIQLGVSSFGLSSTVTQSLLVPFLLLSVGAPVVFGSLPLLRRKVPLLDERLLGFSVNPRFEDTGKVS